MSEIKAEVKTTVKRPTKKITASKSVTEEVQKIVGEVAAGAIAVATAKKSKKTAAAAAPPATEAVAPATSTETAAPADKKAKSAAAYGDEIIETLIREMSLDPKEVSAKLNKAGILKGSSMFKKSKKKVRLAGQPKKALTSYLLFAGDHRQMVKDNNPQISFTETGKAISNLWKVVTPEKKMEYEALALKEKTRFQTEMAAFKASHPESFPAEVAKVIKDRSADPSYIIDSSSGLYVKRTSKLGKELVAKTA